MGTDPRVFAASLNGTTCREKSELVSTSAAPEFETLSSYRWVICALLFAATAINYIDRQILRLICRPIATRLRLVGEPIWIDHHRLSIGLRIRLAGLGRLIDWTGTRIGYALAICVWSLSAAAHGLVNSVAGFGGVRVLLGLGEAGDFSCCSRRAIFEWFPRRERALAVGLFNRRGSSITWGGPL